MASVSVSENGRLKAFFVCLSVTVTPKCACLSMHINERRANAVADARHVTLMRCSYHTRWPLGHLDNDERGLARDRDDGKHWVGTGITGPVPMVQTFVRCALGSNSRCPAYIALDGRWHLRWKNAGFSGIAMRFGHIPLPSCSFRILCYLRPLNLSSKLPTQRRKNVFFSTLSITVPER